MDTVCSQLLKSSPFVFEKSLDINSRLGDIAAFRDFPRESRGHLRLLRFPHCPFNEAETFWTILTFRGGVRTE